MALKTLNTMVLKTESVGVKLPTPADRIGQGLAADVTTHPAEVLSPGRQPGLLPRVLRARCPVRLRLPIARPARRPSDPRRQHPCRSALGGVGSGPVNDGRKVR